MPAAKPLEFRRRAVELAREGDKPVVQIARDLGISESGLRRWMAQAEVDEGNGKDCRRRRNRSWCGYAGRTGLWSPLPGPGIGRR